MKKTVNIPKHYKDEFENKKRLGKLFDAIIKVINNIFSTADNGYITPKQKNLLDKFLFGSPVDYGTKN